MVRPADPTGSGLWGFLYGVPMPSRAPSHSAPRPPTDTKEYDKRRGSPSARGYGHHWQKVRAAILAAEPLCRHCLAEGKLTQATDVDHIVSLRKGGTNDAAGLEPLCHSHHSKKSCAVDGAGWRRKGSK